MNIAEYLKEISKFSLLNREQEVELSKKILSGDTEAKEELVNSNLRLVVSVAKNYLKLGIPLSDLIQEGNVGLIKATEKFDHTQGKRFSTYATFWIKQSILRYITSNKSIIRYPAHIYDTLAKIDKYSTKYRRENNSEPSNLEIANGIGVKEKKVKKYMRLVNVSINSLEESWADGSSSLHSCIADKNDSIEDILVSTVVNNALKSSLTKLNKKEQNVIIHRFGLYNEKKLTLEELGDKLNLTRERIRQIQKRAIMKLKKEMHLENAI